MLGYILLKILKKIIKVLDLIKKNINIILNLFLQILLSPLHIGHCRGAIFGDVLSNLLKFNGNKVTKNFMLTIMENK